MSLSISLLHGSGYSSLLTIAGCHMIQLKTGPPVALLAPAPSSARMAGYSAYTSKVRTAFIVYLTYLYACEFNVVL